MILQFLPNSSTILPDHHEKSIDMIVFYEVLQSWGRFYAVTPPHTQNRSLSQICWMFCDSCFITEDSHNSSLHRNNPPAKHTLKLSAVLNISLRLTLKEKQQQNLSLKIHAGTNTELSFILSRDRSSMTVHSRSGEWPSPSHRAILVPAADQVSSSDTPGAAASSRSQQEDGMKFSCRGLTRGQEAWVFTCIKVKKYYA